MIAGALLLPLLLKTKTFLRLVREAWMKVLMSER